MSLRATAMKQSTPLSSMGPADVVPCLELSVIAPKCREKSVQKVHTSSYKRPWQDNVSEEIGSVSKGYDSSDDDSD